GDIVGDLRVIARIGEVVGALRIRIIIAVIAALRRRGIAQRIDVAAITVEIRIEERLGIGRVELHRRGGAAGRRLEEDGGVLVRLGHVVIVEIERQLADRIVMNELGIGLPAALPAVEVPGLGLLPRDRDIAGIGAAAAEIAGVEAQEGARRVVAARGLVGGHAERLGGIGRIGLHRAAQVAVRGGGEIAGTRRHDDAADILRDHRALRRKAVVVAIALVAQRNAVHRVAELVAGKAMDEDLGVLLVVPPGVGRDVEHAGQRLDRLQRRDAGQDLLDLARRDRGGRARLLGGDEDRAVTGILGRVLARSGRGLVLSQRRCRHGGGGKNSGTNGSAKRVTNGHDTPLESRRRCAAASPPRRGMWQSCCGLVKHPGNADEAPMAMGAASPSALHAWLTYPQTSLLARLPPSGGDRPRQQARGICPA
ncbi:conserved hypothetical protein, partial [Ricinus communis]